MSDSTATIHHDEASAVVDDQGASILAGSDYAFEGDISSRYAQESRWASNVLDNFAPISDGGSWVPQLILTVEEWAEQMATARFDEPTPADVLDLTYTVQDALAKANTKNSASMIERVSLDIYPDVPGRPQDFQHPTAPMIVFLEIKRNSFLWDDVKQRAMAVWFVPNQTKTHLDIDTEPLDSDGEPLDQYRGRFYADTRWLDGYMGVLEYYPSLRLAKEAATELRRAVKIAGTPAPSARTEDPMDEVGRQIDLMDEDDARHKRTGQTAKQRQFAARQQSPC